MVDHLLFCGRIAILTIMSFRDIREQVVFDRDLMWFAFFNTLPLLLSRMYPDNLSLPPVIAYHLKKPDGSSITTAEQAVSALSSLPLWLAQLLFLAFSTGGALFLLLTSLVLKRITSKEMIGKGDVLFSLAAGLGSDYTMSFRMVMIAFVLAMPVAAIIKSARCRQENIAFIPFLALAFLCLIIF
jgi:prepilin signal peptidase PulO-like enzyme (type II secretory pathway)